MTFVSPLMGFLGQIPPEPAGQVEFLEPGTYEWIVPLALSTVSILLVGGGGGGGRGSVGNETGGGGGGALRYQNDMLVYGGEKIIVYVGAGGDGASADNTPGGDGGDSRIIRNGNITLIESKGGSGGQVVIGMAATGGTGSPIGGDIFANCNTV